MSSYRRTCITRQYNFNAMIIQRYSKLCTTLKRNPTPTEEEEEEERKR